MTGFEKFLLIVIFACLVALIFPVTRIIIDIKKQNEEDDDEEEDLEEDTKKRNNRFIVSYRQKYLLTGNELYFYLHLKPIAEKLGLAVLSKIRMADLVEPIATSRKKYLSLFSRIKAKHIDFVLCDPENLHVKLLIELDDASHQRDDRRQRDKFIEAVYKQTGYKLLRLFSNEDIEEKIVEMLFNEKKEQIS